MQGGDAGGPDRRSAKLTNELAEQHGRHHAEALTALQTMHPEIPHDTHTHNDYD